MHGGRWIFVFALLVLWLSISWIRVALHGSRGLVLELSVDRQTAGLIGGVPTGVAVALLRERRDCT